MKYTKLGHSDLNVSHICLGTMTWGLQNTEAEGHEQMDYALAQGVNFFDTAELYAVPPSAETYGKTESIIGTWFEARQNRDQVILATKIAGRGRPYIRDGGPITPAAIDEALEESLKRLKTDYVDLYQLHWPNRDNYNFNRHFAYADHEIPCHDKQQDIDEFTAILQKLDDLIKQGKIRHIGLSNETAWGVMQYLSVAEKKQLPRMISLQNEYSLLCRIPDWDLAETCLKENIGLLAWSPLAFGVLSGKYLDGQRPKGARRDYVSDQGWWREGEQIDAAVKDYIALAQRHNLDPCQMAIAFTLSQPFVASSIIGATTMEQLKTDIAASDIELSKDVKDGIRAIWQKYPMLF